MHYKLLALSALAASASAQVVSSVAPSEVAAILSVLPSSALASALASPSEWAAGVYSDFAAGETPSWYTKLPPAVQTGLIPSGAAYNGTIQNGTAIYNSSSSHMVMTRTQTRRPTHVGGGHGQQTTTNEESSSAAAGSSASGSASSATADGAASMPTAIVGAGLAGAVGIVGLLAL